MKFEYSKIEPLIRRIMSVVLVVVLVCGVILLLKPEVWRFNPQYLVETTILKDKRFSANVQEIISPKLKLKAYLFEEHSNPIVSVEFLFKNAGSAYDPDYKEGLGTLLATMLSRGAGKYDMEAFNAILEQNAIGLDFENTKDDFSGALKFIKSDIVLATKMFNLALTKPTFNRIRLKQAKKDMLDNYKYMLEQPDSYAMLEAAKQLFGKHPYHNSRMGTLDSGQRITVTDLRTFQKQHLTQDNLLIGIAGDVSAIEAGDLIDKLFAGLPRHAKITPIPQADIQITSPDYHISRNLGQNIGFFYAKGVAREDERFYPLVIAIEILSGNGLTSRIQKAAREDKGLTYGVYGDLANYDKSNFIYGRFASTPDKFEQLKQIIQTEWDRLGKSGVTEEELAQAKDYMIASEPLRYADIGNISGTLVAMQKWNLGLDFLQKRNTYIRNITLDEVNQVAKQYFTPDNLRFVTIGDSKKQEQK